MIQSIRAIAARVLWGVLMIASPATSTVRTVSIGDKLPVALESFAEGDTVLLGSGIYEGDLILEKRVTIIGTDYPEIRGGGEGNVIRVTCKGVVLDGLRVSGAGTRLIKDFACIKIEADSVEIKNCHVIKPLHGIYVNGGSYSWIHHNRVIGREDLAESDRGNGIHLWNSRQNLVEDNEISGTRDGIYFSFADSTKIFRNHIHHVRYGLHYMYSNINLFEDNLFEKNVAGAALMYSNEITFRRNVFARCRGFRAYGILFQSMNRTVAEDNLILDNSRGLFFNNSDSNMIVRNDIVDNDLAIQMNGSSDGIAVYGNNFIGNLTNLLADKEHSRTKWLDAGRGNYWSTYRGYDLENDGVGDIPYKLQNAFQVAEIDVPEIRFYLLSPTAELLEAAERALPILGMGTENDSLPLFRQALNGDVPWQKGQQQASEASFMAALLVFLITMIPFWLIHHLSKGSK